MKFLLDVCTASRALREALMDAGHDVLSAADGYADSSDEALLALAYEQNRVLVTEDKDFGRLVFAERLPHRSVVRLVGLNVMEQAQAMRNLIEHHSDAMIGGAIIVVSGKLARIRLTNGFACNDD